MNLQCKRASAVSNNPVIRDLLLLPSVVDSSHSCTQLLCVSRATEYSLHRPPSCFSCGRFARFHLLSFPINIAGSPWFHPKKELPLTPLRPHSPPQKGFHLITAFLRALFLQPFLSWRTCFSSPDPPRTLSCLFELIRSSSVA